MSEQPFQQLQAHKESVKDTVHGVLSTISRVPSLIHAETSKELTTVTTALVSRQASHDNTKKSLDALPKELSHFDKLLDDVLNRSHEISNSLYILKAFNNQASQRQQQQSQQAPNSSSGTSATGSSASLQ